MYSQDPKVQRRRIKLRFFSYGIMAVATVALAALGMLYVLGYRLDDSFNLQRGALVKFDSIPSGATITVDGAAINETGHQANLTAGEHTVSYSLENYQGWQKTVTLQPGEVRYLTYARLLPTVITTMPVQRLDSLHQASTSPNSRWYLLHEEVSSPAFTLVDADGDTIDSDVLQIPAEVYGGPSNSPSDKFNVVAWGPGSDFFLVRYQQSADSPAEFIRVPRDEPEESINLTERFDLQMRNPEFASNTANVLFALDAENTLYRLDVSNPDEAAAVAREVDAFDAHTASRVAYVSPAPAADEATAETDTMAGRSLKIWQRDGEEVTELKPVPEGVEVRVAYLEYFNNEYAALIAGGSASIITSPLSETSRTALTDTLTFNPDYVSVSPGSRFILAAKGSDVYVYDVELEQKYSFTLSGQTRPLRWIDGHHLAYTAGGNLRLVEFDGANTQFVTSMRERYDVLLSGDNEALLSIGTKAGSPVVQRSFLLNEEDR